jgi:hypothetical protein
MDSTVALAFSVIACVTVMAQFHTVLPPDHLDPAPTF